MADKAGKVGHKLPLCGVSGDTVGVQIAGTLKAPECLVRARAENTVQTQRPKACSRQGQLQKLHRRAYASQFQHSHDPVLP